MNGDGAVIRLAAKPGEWPRILNSACANDTHDRCPGQAYIGHGGMPDAPTPDYAPCECDCHAKVAARGDVSAPTPAFQVPQYDAARRRRGIRKQREGGCSVYIPMEALVAAGYDPKDPPPYYRVWGSRRGSVLVRLYREP